MKNMTTSNRRGGSAKVPPPLDVHAHVDPELSAEAIRGLGAFVFAMTRSLDEYALVADRRDTRLVWGAGTHPGRKQFVTAFDVDRFTEAIQGTPLVGEIGLDGGSTVPMAEQVAAFRTALGVLQQTPRLVSIHSASAHLQVIRELHRTPVEGIVLHWWTGSADLTEEALRLGCAFSVPPAMLSNRAVLDQIPPDRLLLETDHPYGDRRSVGTRKPGNVAEVEHRLGERLSRTPFEMRQSGWATLRKLILTLDLRNLFPDDWRSMLDLDAVR
ncbi:TatD family hydrolase [Curtobacterium flaccumfaciens pv. flaccumfaciens]|uniref:TatD family hydrolase n=1 Tax=Curtobacterium flaccumfaciens TaxID=2035 RepID=UPI00399481E4